MNTTNKKSIFVNPKIKKIIELNMNLNSFTSRNDALVDLLEGSEKYHNLLKILDSISPITPKGDITDVSKKNFDKFL